MSKYPFPQSVEDVAKVLDTEYPQWEKKINIETLNMNSQTECILGQIFGRYLLDKEREWWGRDSYCGQDFLAHSRHKQNWIKEINKRLNKETKVSVSLTFGQAMDALYAGKKVKHSGWNTPIRLENNKLLTIDNITYSAYLSAFVQNEQYKTGWSIVDTVTIDSLKPGDKFTRENDEVVYTRTTEPDRQLYDGCKLKVLSQYLEVTKVS